MVALEFKPKLQNPHLTTMPQCSEEYDGRSESNSKIGIPKTFREKSSVTE